MTGLTVDPGWQAFPADGGVRLTAGADLVYHVPDLPKADAAFLLDLFGSDRQVEPDGLPDGVRQLIPRLQALGALRPTGLPSHPDPTVRIVFAGTRSPALRTALAGDLSVVDDDADLILVVRTTSTWQDIIDVAAELRRPHLLLDLAYHHSMAIGPLVVPGASACLGCMALRIARRWGDRPPCGHVDPGLPAALAAHAVRRIAAGSLALLDRVVTYDLDELTTTAENVLPSVGCLICPQVTVGRVVLPWEET